MEVVLYTKYYILLEFFIIDIIFFLLAKKYIKLSKLEKLVNKRISRNFDFINLGQNKKLENKMYRFLIKRMREDRVNFERERDYKNYLVFQYILPIVLFLFIVMKFGIKSFPLILIPFLHYASNRVKFKKIKTKRHLSFQKNTYKIYKFIYNQVSSGVRPHDCVIGLYDVIEDKYFKRSLINMSAIYSQTSDIDLSLKSITDVYPGIDAIMLCGAIKQGIQIGSNMETVERQEKLAFNKYFIYIKTETEKIRFKGFLSISLFAFIIILLISVPLLYEMKEATTKIFMN